MQTRDEEHELDSRFTNIKLTFGSHLNFTLQGEILQPFLQVRIKEQLPSRCREET